MYQPPPGHQTILQTQRRDECMESRLVLSAVGIASESVRHDGGWSLVVRDRDAVVATDELTAYQLENRERRQPRTTKVPLYGGAGWGVLIYLATIVGVFVLDERMWFGGSWVSVGRMSAGDVTSGQLWRCVTALTLHADVQHLASNMAFGALFGFLAGRVLGGGVAWLAIVLAGSLGNLINAWVQSPNHDSIGASTAVFSALGLLVAHALRPASSFREKALRRWSPLIGGVVLLGMTGVGGERTDVVAHVTGFLAGLALGWLGCRLPHARLASARVQRVSAIAALAIVLFSWIIAFWVVD